MGVLCSTLELSLYPYSSLNTYSSRLCHPACPVAIPHPSEATPLLVTTPLWPHSRLSELCSSKNSFDSHFPCASLSCPCMGLTPSFPHHRRFRAHQHSRTSNSKVSLNVKLNTLPTHSPIPQAQSLTSSCVPLICSSAFSYLCSLNRKSLTFSALLFPEVLAATDSVRVYLPTCPEGSLETFQDSTGHKALTKFT